MFIGSLAFFPAPPFYAHWLDGWLARLKSGTWKSTGNSRQVVVVVVVAAVVVVVTTCVSWFLVDIRKSVFRE